MTQFLTFNASGQSTGVGFTPDGTIPSFGVECTADQAKNWQSWGLVNGSLVGVTPPALSPAQQATAALSAGIAISSTSTPSLNGVYACDSSTQGKINRIVSYIGANGKFPASLSEMPWPDINGTVHLFPSTSIFIAFGSATANYVVELEAVIMGVTNTLPASGATIP